MTGGDPPARPGPGQAAPRAGAAAADATGGERPAPLREADVFTLAPPGMLERARDYLLLGRVARPRRRGAVLAADVEGTEDVHRTCAVVTGGPDGVPRVEARCDCPSARSLCRHVLAVLLLWARAPEGFAPVDAWEDAAREAGAAAAARALADAAMGLADPLEALGGVAQEPDWDAQPPGRCLEAWEAFRRAAARRGAWPEAAFALAARIAGPPGVPAADGSAGVAPAGAGGAGRAAGRGGAPRPSGRASGPPGVPAVAARQLAWWLTLVADELPPPALRPWLEHLFALLEGGFAQGGLPPETAVWLARVAVALPEARWSEASWLVRFASGAPAQGAFEAELRRLYWEAQVRWRLALPEGGGGAPGAVPRPAAARRARRLLRLWRSLVRPRAD